MGMDADLLAIGHFNKEIIGCLDYSPDFYEDTKEGSFIITTIVTCCTTDLSRQLAACLHITSWNFDTHFIIPECINGKIYNGQNEINKELFIEVADNEYEGEEIWNQLFKLVKHGFCLFYRPNG